MTFSRAAMFSIYKKFTMGSGCSMLLGESSKVVLQDGEFSQSDNTTLSIGDSSTLALSGSMYLEKGSNLTTSTQSYNRGRF